MIPKYYELDESSPALKKSEFNSLLKTVKNASFNLKDNDSNKSKNNFVKRSLLDIALANNDDKYSENNEKNDTEKSESNPKSENKEVPSEEINTDILDDNVQKDEDLILTTEDDSINENKKEKIFEERLIKAEEEAYAKGKNDGILEGHQKGMDEARRQSEEGLEAAISTFRNASEKIINSDENILLKLHSSIEKSILEIAKEYAGFCIDEMPEKFIRRIEKLTKIINKNISSISIKINDSDYKSIKSYIEKDETLQFLKFQVDENFSRGDIRLNSEGIQIDEIFEAAEISQFSLNKAEDNNFSNNIQTSAEEPKDDLTDTPDTNAAVEEPKDD